MQKKTTYLDEFIFSAQKAIKLEVTENVRFVNLLQTGERDFHLSYVFENAPSDDDLEALSLIETEIVGGIWRWIGQLKYNWITLEASSENMEGTPTITIYKNFLS